MVFLVILFMVEKNRRKMHSKYAEINLDLQYPDE